MKPLSRALGLAFALTASTIVSVMVATPAHAATASPTAALPLVSPQNDDAMLNLLMEDGVQYATASAADDAVAYSGSDTTLVIDQDETNMSASDIAELATSAWGRVVILSYDPSLLQAFAPGVGVSGGLASTSTAAPTSTTSAAAASPLVSPGPGCTQSNAVSAGSVVMPEGSETYSLPRQTPSPAPTSSTSTTKAQQDTDLTACYFVDGSDNAPALVSLHNDKTGGDVILLGWTDFAENQYMAQQGDAALALGLFGAHGTLVWLATQFTEDNNLNGCVGQACGSGSASGNPSGNPSAQGGGSGGGSGSGGNGGGGVSSQAVTLAQLIPHWIWWMLLQLVIAAMALAYWRSRRLGRLVSENLPVKVRAAETVEGHANLYRRAAAHGRAAALLRSATARRIAPLLGLPAGPAGRNPQSLVQPAAQRLSRPPDQVHAILAGEPPQTEAELVRLTDQLDLLEQEVRSP